MVLEVGDVLAITDYFVITGGTNTRQVRTVAEEIELQVTEAGGPEPLRVEGLDTAQWVLLDYGDFVVHVFLDEARAFYELERLWRDVPTLDWAADDAGPVAPPSARLTRPVATGNRILVVGDVHYDLRQLDWLLATAGGFQLVVIVGDLLDVSSTVPLGAQIPVVLRYLERLGGSPGSRSARATTTSPAPTPTASRPRSGWRAPPSFGVVVDTRVAAGGRRTVNVYPWWDGPIGRQRLEDRSWPVRRPIARRGGRPLDLGVPLAAARPAGQLDRHQVLRRRRRGWLDRPLRPRPRAQRPRPPVALDRGWLVDRRIRSDLDDERRPPERPRAELRDRRPRRLDRFVVQLRGAAGPGARPPRTGGPALGRAPAGPISTADRGPARDPRADGVAVVVGELPRTSPTMPRPPRGPGTGG